jgi:RND family efflux transporter MFP subunit
MSPLARSLLLLTSCLVLSAGVTGCSKAPAPEEEVWIAPVKVAPARQITIGELTEMIGATQPLPGRGGRITAPVEGHVVSVLTDDMGHAIQEGQAVEKDQVVARLDDRVVRAQRDKVLAQLDEIKESRKQADLAYQGASLDVDRLTKLIPQGTASTGGLISQIELEKAKLNQQDAESKQRAVTAKEKTLRADLHALDVQLHYYELRSPIAGVLGSLQVVPGQTLTPGTTVAEVTDLSQVDVVIFAAPRPAQKLRVSQSAWLPGKEPDVPDKAGPEGQVVFIAVQAQPDTGNFLVKVRFPNDKLKLRSNQVTRAFVETQAEKQRLTIPEAALMEDQEPPLVVVAEDVKTETKEGKEERTGKAKRLRAHIGVRDRAHHVVEIHKLEDPESKKTIPAAQALFIVEGGHGLHNGDLLKMDDYKEAEKH